MIYLKTIFSTPSEIKYLKLMIQEAYEHIDKMIISEFNYTHTGQKRDLIFKNYIELFTPKEREKIAYMGVDLTGQIKNAVNNESIAHENEKLMRGYFVKEFDVKDDDIIFSVDADEVIFSQYYLEIINKLNNRKWPWQKKSYRLPMRQFFYKMNYQWENMKFTSAIACKASYFLKKGFPSQWRDDGAMYEKYVGSHYSWCISIDEMVSKIQNYAHQEQFSHLADYDVMKNAVSEKIYPFDKNREFKINVIDIRKRKDLFPKSLYKNLDIFSEVIAEK